MRPFDYIATETLEETCNALAHHGKDARILAGGTDLLLEFRRASRHMPGVVVDISRIQALRSINHSDGEVSLGALTTHSQLQHSKTIQTFAPLLSVAASTIGSFQIRNRGTVGGNIMNAATCADTVPPLIALGATVTLQSKESKRQLALAELFVRPYETCVRPDEVLVEIRFPKLPSGAQGAFIKLGRRNVLSIARLSVAAVLRRDNEGRIVDASIVPGAAFPTWRRICQSEKLLIGQRPSRELFTAAGKMVSDSMIAETGRRWSTEYKEPVLAVLVRRALEQCVSDGVVPGKMRR